VAKKGFTLVEIMIVVAIIALLAAFAIPGLIRTRVTANNTAAQTTLRALSTAAENFASANGGVFPANEAALTGPTPPFLNRPYCGLAYSGFTFTCAFNTAAYTFVATPVTLDASGSTTYTITTGGVLTP
jgi:type IV pilus assembly protein PilA